ncbi:hypothetical protein CHLNCDRAFT_141350 [Chlorella variabilis]|uniref:Calcineurin-like phosphoesterase domain-containing protein n=1 Tax=Chlorella variabilis TaxID=554065 RepID=E1ZSP5_CHLVA|nr:hypothetical protein CHLNCDRAFT_141350 [Chlorella variabilis]EFN51188.1 hypothetical protein CHLNCDRAFT_141350 [Chlorella variabilis]|eukprot:XP_005843290.1 hypothetical protein CHLNCDRAFT_141350 [Chlorella variabilis]
MSLHERLSIGLIVAGGAVLLGHRALAALRERQVRRPRTPHGNPAPKELHVVLPPSATMWRRIIVVGDIHGCPEELQALLDKVRYRKGVDLLVSVGDLVNKGPDSEKVIKLAMESDCLAVRGNHDDSAYEAFRCWLDGKDIPKPKKQGWLPAYGVIVVHAGLVPGVPLEQQGMLEMEKMRDVVPAVEAAPADAAADALAAGADVATLPLSSFDWRAAGQALAQLAAADEGGSSRSRSGSDGAEPEAAGSRLPAELQLVGREVPNPLGRAWAEVWRGPQHVFFGHDAKRRLQLCPAATGLDTGCVYGGQLSAAVLPPLDERGQPLLQRLNLPPDAREFRLCGGLPAYLVQVAAREVHSDKFLRLEEREKGARQEAAKQHTLAALELQPRRQGAGASGSGSVGASGSGAAAGAAKAAADKKEE